MEEQKGWEGTELGANRGKGSELDLDTLIKETLAESEKTKSEEKRAAAAEKPLSSTPISLPPKKEEAKTAPPPAESKKEIPSAYEATFKEYRTGDIVKGKVAKADATGILVDIGYKAEGLILPEEGVEAKVGDEIQVMIENLENKEGYVVLSFQKALHELKWKTAYDAFKNKKVLEAKVTSAVKGGLVVDWQGIRGFIPASQITKKPETPLEDFVNQLLPVKIIELNRRQGKAVLSHKLAEPEKQKLEADKLLEKLEVGQVKRGKVVSLKTFGAFVDIGGIEGLVHLSELSWKRVNHPSAVLKIGEELDVFVLGVDRVNRKVALGLKELQTDPWVTVGEKYRVGQVIKVKVARLTKFGAFVDIDDQLEGLVHVSELSPHPISKPEEAVKPGDELEVKILKILPEEQKIGLSARQVILDRERQTLEKAKKEKEEQQRVTIADTLAEKERQKEEAVEEVYEVIEGASPPPPPPEEKSA